MGKEFGRIRLEQVTMENGLTDKLKASAFISGKMVRILSYKSVILKITFPIGDKYEGEFKKSLKDGKGTEFYHNGDKYIGEYLEGRPCGYGEYYWAQGAIYKGHFCDGLMDGKGTYINSRGDRYEGNYKEGKKHGYGEFTWISGNVYKGNYENDLREGYGEMYWTDGSCYKGEWVKGIQHGRGEMMLFNQRRVNGQFTNNTFIEETPIKKVVPLPKLVQSRSPNSKTDIRARKLQKSGGISSRGLAELNASVSKAISVIKTKMREALVN